MTMFSKRDQAQPRLMPTPPALRAPPTAPPHQLHPAAQEAAAAYSQALDELDGLRTENGRLRHELESERRARHDLQTQFDLVAEKRDYYLRYCVEINTHLIHIEAACHLAKQRALDLAAQSKPAGAPVGDNDPHDEQAGSPTDLDADAAIADLARQFPRTANGTDRQETH